MKKGSGFEKFFKGKEKTGGAKKEQIRKEKRDFRKEREEQIAAHKRNKRAQAKSTAPGQPPKYNLDPPGSRSQKNPDDRHSKKTFRIEKKSGTDRNENSRNDRPAPPRKTERTFQKSNAKPRFKPKDDRQGFKPKDSRQRFKDKDERPQKARPELRPQGPRGDASNENSKSKGIQLKPSLHKQTAGGASSSDPAIPAEQMPLNKYIAHSGVCSRRDAVALIKAGKVKVNGELILEPGHKVAISDDVKVAGKRLDPVRDFVYILLNKPKDYITTTDDPQERKTVLDLLQGAPSARIYPVGRLDRNTSGVLLLTNDGDLSQKLTHPSNEIKKVYAVTLDKPLTRHHFEEILKGVPLEDGPAHVDTLAFTDAQDHTQLGVELHSGRNRIVRRIFEHFGYDVKALDRVVFAGLTKKNVNRGKWRFLSEKEVRDLKFFKKGKK